VRDGQPVRDVAGRVTTRTFLYVDDSGDALAALGAVDEDVVEAEVAVQQPGVGVLVLIGVSGKVVQSGGHQSIVDPPLARRIQDLCTAWDEVGHDGLERDGPAPTIGLQVAESVDRVAVDGREDLAQLPDRTLRPDIVIQQHIQRRAGELLLHAEGHGPAFGQRDRLDLEHHRCGDTGRAYRVQRPTLGLEPGVGFVGDPHDEPVAAVRRRVVHLVVLTEDQAPERPHPRADGRTYLCIDDRPRRPHTRMAPKQPGATRFVIIRDHFDIVRPVQLSNVESAVMSDREPTRRR